MFDRIMLGTDFTALSARAEDMAIEIAKKHDSELCLIHVIETVPYEDVDDPSMAGFYATLTHEAEAKIDTIATRCVIEGVRCRARVEVGRRWMTMEAVAREIGAKLIVLGARANPRERAIATTGHKVFITADRPVLFVPEN